MRRAARIHRFSAFRVSAFQLFSLAMPPPAREDRDDLVIGFDADDTLWHNESLFEVMHTRFREVLARHHDADAAAVERTLFDTEMRNLDLYGYGVKSFTLSAIETAVELTAGRISAAEVRQILELGRDILKHPVELLDGVADTLAALAGSGSVARLLVITKGDLHHQEQKLARSGLLDLFAHTEIVSDKNEATYATVLRRHDIAPDRFLMVGNSLRSDILPVLALGGAGAHIPYPLLWAHEHAEPPAAETSAGRFFALQSIRELPAAVETWAAATVATACGSSSGYRAPVQDAAFSHSPCSGVRTPDAGP
jgi:putative hydrolase of the HAD superfamily